MLENTVTLTLPNGGTPVEKVATRIGVVSNDRSTYNIAGHTTLSRKMLSFGRTYPKRNGAFLGVARGNIKITLDRSVLDAKGATIVSPDILDISMSIPVGADDATVDVVVDYLAALAARRDLIKRLILGPEI